MTYEETTEAIESLKGECNFLDFEVGCKRKCNTDGRDCFVKLSIEALEKQVPKKPIKKMVTTKWSNWRPLLQFWTCPTCSKAVEVDDNEGFQTEYYPSCECGQRIDWTGILEDYELKWNDYEVVE